MSHIGTQNRVKGSLLPSVCGRFPREPSNAPTVTSVNYPRATVTFDAGASLDFATGCGR